MTRPIRRVAVLGAGVMGAGIAAHVANAGLPALLLDIVPPNLENAAAQPKAARDAFAAGSLKKLLKDKPSAFFNARNAELISIGNFDDDLEKLADCDLIIEAIVERLDIKQRLFEKLDKICGGDTIVASNTSGLRISDMLEGRSERFRQHFLVMHFFNPPRYMKLLELVAGPGTAATVKSRVENFGQNVLGKGIVWAKDSPNFIANRIGCHAVMATIGLMDEYGLTLEDVDAISGEPMGHPKSATFRTADMVGIDTLAHVIDNCHKSLVNDEEREIFVLPAYIRQMIENKQLGNKTRGGFYKKSKAGIETLDHKTGQYRGKGGDEAIKKATKGLAKIEDVKERVKKLVATEGVVGEFAWKVLSRSMAYSARRVGEIGDDVAGIDKAMQWGFNWDLGPFETWDALGFAETVDRMEKDGIALPASIKKMRADGAKGFYADGKVYDLAKGAYTDLEVDPRETTLTILRKGGAPVLKNNGAEAWDLGDGILGLTLKTKANSIDPDVMQMIHDAVAKAETDFRGMLIANEGEHFSVGANLFLVVMAAQQKQWDQLRDMIAKFQSAIQAMKYASVPVIAAPYGMTLGGGLELCLGSDGVQAAAETYAGLVEVGVGLIPGGAGTLNMLWRALEGIPDGVDADVYPFVTQVFKNIALARVATSGGEAQAYGYFRNNDGLSFDRARQLHEAKQRVIGLANSGYHAPLRRAYKLPGDSGIATLKMMVGTLVAGGYASEHDALIAGKLAEVLCGGVSGATHAVTEDEILELEREAFLSLCGEPKSQERMQFMLMNNKPLRN